MLAPNLWNEKLPSGEEWEGVSKSDNEERSLCQVWCNPCPDGSEDHEGEADSSSWQRRLLPQHPLQPDLKEPRSQVESLIIFINCKLILFCQVCGQWRELRRDWESSWQRCSTSWGGQGWCDGGVEHALQGDKEMPISNNVHHNLQIYLIHNYNWIMQLRCHRQILVQQWTASSSVLKLINNDFCFHLSEL